MVNGQINTAQQGMARNGNTVTSVSPVSAAVPMAGILSRFVPQMDRLDRAERQRLMDACADECRECPGQEIDWVALDSLNTRIGETFTRSELVSLLIQYKAAIAKGAAT